MDAKTQQHEGLIDRGGMVEPAAMMLVRRRCNQRGSRRRVECVNVLGEDDFNAHEATERVLVHGFPWNRPRS
jgi:hypothetical protein